MVLVSECDDCYSMNKKTHNPIHPADKELLKLDKKLKKYHINTSTPLSIKDKIAESSKYHTPKKIRDIILEYEKVKYGNQGSLLVLKNWINDIK